MAQSNRVTPEVPLAVRKAAKNADALHKQFYGDKKPDKEEPTADVAPVEDVAGAGGDIQPVEPQAQTDSTGDTSQPPLEEGAAEVSEVGKPSPKDTTDAPSDPAPKDEWETKYKSLKGKYDAEVPRLASELRDMRAQVADLIAAQKARATQTPPPTKEEAPKKDVVSEQDLVDYGEDLVDFIKRVARAEASTATETLTPKIAQIEGQFTQSKRQQATTSVYSKLDADVQDWREINKSAEFLNWLAEPDPYTGDYRKNLLGSAFESGDANRVVAFFRGYLAEQRAVAPQPKPDEPATGKKTQMSLEQLAGPKGRATAATARPQENSSPSWTRAQVAAFYHDVNSGAYAKDPQRKAQIEASIAAALASGNIS